MTLCVVDTNQFSSPMKSSAILEKPRNEIRKTVYNSTNDVVLLI